MMDIRKQVNNLELRLTRIEKLLEGRKKESIVEKYLAKQRELLAKVSKSGHEFFGE